MTDLVQKYGLKKYTVTEIGMVKTATFGPEIDPSTGIEMYRYSLGRDWGGGHRETVAYFGLNPSTATHEEDDATIRREIGFARRWGFKRMLKGNAFAYRSRDPLQLYAPTREDRIIGPANDEVILEIAEQAEMIVVCWGGTHGTLYRRDRQMTTLLSGYEKKVFCFGRSKNGQPLHPLYLANDTPLVPFFVDPGPVRTL